MKYSEFEPNKLSILGLSINTLYEKIIKLMYNSQRFYIETPISYINYPVRKESFKMNINKYYINLLFDINSRNSEDYVPFLNF